MIEEARQRLHEYIERYGLSHPKTIMQSQVLDRLLNRGEVK